jgi:hypothetical protein
MAAKERRTFVHQHYLDPDWQPGPGERYRDAPRALMEVSRATSTHVWYRYAGGTSSGWVMPRETFEAEYPNVL